MCFNTAQLPVVRGLLLLPEEPQSAQDSTHPASSPQPVVKMGHANAPDPSFLLSKIIPKYMFYCRLREKHQN